MRNVCGHGRCGGRTRSRIHRIHVLFIYRLIFASEEESKTKAPSKTIWSGSAVSARSLKDITPKLINHFIVSFVAAFVDVSVRLFDREKRSFSSSYEIHCSIVLIHTTFASFCPENATEGKWRGSCWTALHASPLYVSAKRMRQDKDKWRTISPMPAFTFGILSRPQRTQVRRASTTYTRFVRRMDRKSERKKKKRAHTLAIVASNELWQQFSTFSIFTASIVVSLVRNTSSYCILSVWNRQQCK